MLARALTIGAIFYFLFASLVRNWGQLQGRAFTLDWRGIALSYVVFGIYLVNRALIWHWMTRKFGCAIPLPKAMAAWFYSLLGKYVPGKVFLLAGRLHFYSQEGSSALRVSMCFALETVCILLASVLVLLVAPLFADLAIIAQYRVPALILVALFLVVIPPRHLERLANPLLRLARRPPILLPLRYRDVLAMVGLFTANWTLLGLGFYLMIVAIHPLGIRYLVYLAGSFALATTVGILALFAPAGLGVREAILVVALSAIMPKAMAIVVALVSRVWMTLGEVLAVGAVALALRLRPAPSRPVKDSPPESECREGAGING